MSKTLTVYIVDSCSLNGNELDRVNAYLETIILNRVFWARKTHQIAVAVGKGTGNITNVLPFQPVDNTTWNNWERIKGTEVTKSSVYDDIMDMTKEIRQYVKKLKFTKRIIWFGGNEIEQIKTINKSLNDAGISFTAVVPNATCEPFNDLEDFCTEYDHKEVAPVGFYDGVLTLGHPNAGGFLEVAVKCYPFCRKSNAPTTHAVYDAAGKIEQVSIARDKHVNEQEINVETLSKGYSYGSEIITIPQQLDEKVRQGSGIAIGNGFEIIAFVDHKHPQLFTGESSVVCATDSESQEMLSVMTSVLFYQEKVAIARFSKKAKTANIQLVFLEPHIQAGEPDRFLMTLIPFSEDWKRLSFTDLAQPEQKNIPGDHLISEMDNMVDSLDIQAMGYSLDDFIVPNPRVDRIMQYMADVYAQRPINIKKPRLPISLLDDTRLLEEALDLKMVLKSKIVQEQEDLIADEQDLNLDELL